MKQFLVQELEPAQAEHVSECIHRLWDDELASDNDLSPRNGKSMATLPGHVRTSLFAFVRLHFWCRKGAQVFHHGHRWTILGAWRHIPSKMSIKWIKTAEAVEV